jgi:hypothetical protein
MINPDPKSTDSTPARAFARLTASDATHIAQDQEKEGLFLTFITVHPEPEIGILD